MESTSRLLFCIGDCAYTLAEKLLPIYRSEQVARERYDNYNYYTSQLHICIEMAFAFMVKRWSILQRPITIANHSIEHLICSIGVLHNYCINEQLFIAVEMVFLSQKTLTFLQKRQYCKTLLQNLMEKIWCITLQHHILITGNGDGSMMVTKIVCAKHQMAS